MRNSIMSGAVVIVASCTAAADTGIGEPAPALSISEYLQAPDDAPRDFAWLEGTVVVLEFWTTWCVPCVAAIPHLNELAEHFEDQPVQFIAISNEDRETVAHFLEDHEMNAWVAIDDERATFRDYNIVGIPRTFLIDKQGNIAGATHPNSLGKGHIARVLEGKDAGLDDPNIPGRVVAIAGEDPAGESDHPTLFQILIRQADPPLPGTMPAIARQSNAVTMDGVSAATIVRQGYQFPEGRIEVERDLAEGFFALVASVPEGFEHKLRPLIRQAVEITFGVEAVEETRRLNVLVLTAPNVDDHADAIRPSEATGRSMTWHMGTWEFSGTTIADILGLLETDTAMLIVDETGLDDRLDITLTYDRQTRRWPKEKRIEEISRALREQLGLELTPAERDIRYLVIRQRRIADREHEHAAE